MGFMGKDPSAVTHAEKKIRDLEISIQDIILDPEDDMYIYNKNKYNHKKERIEAYKRVIDGTDKEYDFFLFYIHVMIWRERDKSDPYYKERTDPTSPIYKLTQDIYGKEVHSLAYYADHDLKELFQLALNGDIMYIKKKYGLEEIE